MAKPALFCLIASALAWALLKGAPASAWQRNDLSLRYLQGLNVERSLAEPSDILYLQPEIEPAQFVDARATICHDLWHSRLAASFNLERASQLSERAQTCPHYELVTRWKGYLHWKMGEQAMARARWASLPAPYLVRWGRNVALAGDTDLGKVLLQTAEAQGEHLDLDEQALLYQTLGELSRQEDSPREAISYYQKAWGASGYGYDIAYHLGVLHAREGNCEQAIFVWETGLRKRPDRERPALDSSYLIQLGECYAQVGNRAQAQAFLEAAQVTIDRHQLTDRQPWLDAVRRKLQRNGEP